MGTGLDNEVGVGGIELTLHFLATIDQLCDIDLGGDGELRAALQTLVHTFSDHLTHTPERNALGRRGRCCTLCWCRSRCSGRCRSLTPSVDDLLYILPS